MAPEAEATQRVAGDRELQAFGGRSHGGKARKVPPRSEQTPQRRNLHLTVNDLQLFPAPQPVLSRVRRRRLQKRRDGRFGVLRQAD
jgi:hypothetical protein